MQVCKPVLKWVGGKTQIIDDILEKFPKDIANYHETFVGGGSVLLGLLSYANQGMIRISGCIYASDINKNLIYFYLNVQNNVESLLDEVKVIADDYKTCKDKKGDRNPVSYDDAKNSQESYYYWIRACFNALNEDDRQGAKASAMFLFLNKTGFRGLYRENSKGCFNVPFGNYANPSIYDDEHLRFVSKIIKDVIFTVSSFDERLRDVICDGDFVYLDPPYAPESATSFVSYNSDGFDVNQHKKLFELCHSLTDKKIKFMMSNADVRLVKDEFKDRYIIDCISCRRTINSKRPDAKTNEVLIRNWLM